MLFRSLTNGTTYYAVVTACDGNANCTVASEVSFTPLSEWTVVANAIDTYITNQYVATDDGEAGFLMDGGPWTGTGTTLKDRIDSNNDGVILGEGDDAANAPVLIDVYSPFSTFIPGTSYRLSGAWTTGADITNAPALAGKVADHRTAGFRDRKSTRLNSSHIPLSRMPSSA